MVEFQHCEHTVMYITTILMNLFEDSPEFLHFPDDPHVFCSDGIV